MEGEGNGDRGGVGRVGGRWREGRMGMGRCRESVKDGRRGKLDRGGVGRV